MARGRPRLFGNTETEPAILTLKKKNLKNDLLSGKNEHFTDLRSAYKLIEKHGFSQKTEKLTAKFNPKMRQDLKINTLEYFALAIAISENGIGVDTIKRLTGENSPAGLVNSLQIFFNLYSRNIFAAFPGSEGIFFKLSPASVDYFYNNKDFVPRSDKSLKKIIQEIDTIANLYNSMEIMSELGERAILNILNDYKDSYEYCGVLHKLYLEREQIGHCYKFVFYMLGHLIVNSYEYPKIDKEDPLIESFASQSPQNENIVNHVFTSDKHPLFQRKIFDHSIDESGKADKNAIEIHADFKRKYLKDIIREKKHDDLIKPAKIAKKKLYYNPETQKKVDELYDLLSVKSFNNIKKRLAKEGTRTGFIILLSGDPGTGKTELCLQLAKEIGRDIIKVDMSSLRSKWWGEDEKNIKQIFTNYNSVLQDSRVEPILLLNEADAIIGKRLDVGGNNGAIISSINATQNIILDAFDEFEGILIATTNLTKNFDAAFERRFLYKLEIDKPNVEVRAQILVDKLKIPYDDALVVAGKVELSGGNIENMYRKMTTKKVLFGENYSLDMVLNLARDERIEKEKTIGFGT